MPLWTYTMALIGKGLCRQVWARTFQLTPLRSQWFGTSKVSLRKIYFPPQVANNFTGFSHAACRRGEYSRTSRCHTGFLHVAYCHTGILNFGTTDSLGKLKQKQDLLVTGESSHEDGDYNSDCNTEPPVLHSVKQVDIVDKVGDIGNPLVDIENQTSVHSSTEHDKRNSLSEYTNVDLGPSDIFEDKDSDLSPIVSSSSDNISQAESLATYNLYGSGTADNVCQISATSIGPSLVDNTTNTGESPSIYNGPTNHLPGNNVNDLVPNDYPEVPLDRKFILSSNWRGNNLFKHGIKFKGNVFVVKQFEDEQLYTDVLAEFANCEVLGFDSEHCSSQGMVCVIQLASNDKAMLWQCYNFNRSLPPGLTSLLTGCVFKTGHACLQDAFMISNQFRVHSKHLIDTCHWARDLHCLPRSLQAMCAIFLDEHLSKRHQQSNWKKESLTPGQISYAATDAWISLRVNQEMKMHAERLGVQLTPAFRSLHQYAMEVKNSRRLKRLRYKQRQKELKKRLKMEQGTVTKAEETSAQPSALYNRKELSDDAAQKQSAGSRKRSRKFNAKFHVLE